MYAHDQRYLETSRSGLLTQCLKWWVPKGRRSSEGLQLVDKSCRVRRWIKQKSCPDPPSSTSTTFWWFSFFSPSFVFQGDSHRGVSVIPIPGEQSYELGAPMDDPVRHTASGRGIITHVSSAWHDMVHAELRAECEGASIVDGRVGRWLN